MMGKYTAGAISYYASTKELYDIVGDTGDNTTGVSVGGFTLANDKFYIVGNSMDQTAENYQNNKYDTVQRNIFLMITDKNMSAPTMTKLTNYTDGTVKPNTPHITKLDDGSLIIMWEEKDSSSNYKTKIVKINSSGSITKTAESLVSLSDCPPLLGSDNKLHWYVTSSSVPIFYTLDINTLETPKSPAESVVIDSSGTLEISGTGFLPSGTMPWADQAASIKHVVVKNGVYSLPDNAFQNCTALEDVVLGDTVSSIGASAFNGCTSLKSVEMPDKLNYLGSSAFEGCSSLTHITVPEGVTAIYSSTFLRCSNLETIDLPETLTTLSSMSLYGSGIKSIKLPKSLKTISYASFWSCNRLTALTIPEGVTTIGRQAFAYSGINYIAFPASATNLDSSMLSDRNIANIYCVKGSSAEDFMKNNSKNYNYIGDIDGDKNIGTEDIKAILQFADGIKDPFASKDTQFRADADLDEKVDILDAIRALEF